MADLEVENEEVFNKLVSDRLALYGAMFDLGRHVSFLIKHNSSVAALAEHFMKGLNHTDRAGGEPWRSPSN